MTWLTTSCQMLLGSASASGRWRAPGGGSGRGAAGVASWTTSSQMRACAALSFCHLATSSGVAGPTALPSTSLTQRPGLYSR